MGFPAPPAPSIHGHGPRPLQYQKRILVRARGVDFILEAPGELRQRAGFKAVETRDEPAPSLHVMVVWRRNRDPYADRILDRPSAGRIYPGGQSAADPGHALRLFH